MNLHEYQAKNLLSKFGIAVPEGMVLSGAESLPDADSVQTKLGQAPWVVKAQVHAGGRGKGGGVRVVTDHAELVSAVHSMIGQQLVTHQTDSNGLPVHSVLVEAATDIARELYLSVLVDRAQERLVIMASASGGMDIERVAAETPEKILSAVIDPAAGLQAYQARDLGFALELTAPQVSQFSKMLKGIVSLFNTVDASLVEINPLVVNTDGALMAVDGKINLDDSALYRHPELLEQRDETQEDLREAKAQTLGLNYITLTGSIGCLVNGAGLAMATMDLVKLHGGAPANFLDVGGGATAERVAEAFKLILSDTSVKVILVNIFGGIVRCDLIAEGIIAAVKQEKLSVPVVVRLEGTNVEAGRTLLAESGLDVIVADDLTDAAVKAVAAEQAA